MTQWHSVDWRHQPRRFPRSWATRQYSHLSGSLWNLNAPFSIILRKLAAELCFAGACDPVHDEAPLPATESKLWIKYRIPELFEVFPAAGPYLHIRLLYVEMLIQSREGDGGSRGQEGGLKLHSRQSTSDPRVFRPTHVLILFRGFQLFDLSSQLQAKFL